MVHYDDGLQVVPNPDNGLYPRPGDNEHKYLAVKEHAGVLRPQDEKESAALDRPTRRREICGVSRRCFWILLGVLGLLVVAAAVGGGVGGSMSGKSTSKSTTSSSDSSSASDTSSSPTSTTPTSTTGTSSTTSATPSGTDIAVCPSSNNTVYTPSSSDLKFIKTCNIDYWPPGLNGYTNNIATSLNQLNVSSLDSCIDLCVSYNTKQNVVAGKGGCMAVALDMSMTDPDALGECWLKNSTGRHIDVDPSGADTAVACVVGLC